MKYLLAFCCCLTLLPLWAQWGEPSPEMQQPRNPYLRFLLVGDSNTRCALVNVSYKYLFTPSTQAFAAKGGHAGIGLNLARFFTDRFILGICIDTKQFQGNRSQAFSPAFREDFNTYFIADHPTEELAQAAQTLSGGINGSEGYSVKGNSFSNVGIQFSPFPDRYGALMLTVMRGGSQFSFSGPYNAQLYEGEDGIVPYLTLQRALAMELSMQPYFFFRKGRTPLTQSSTWKSFYRFLTVSVYYEQLRFRGARFYGQPLETFTGAAFATRRLDNFGLKVGVSIY